MRRLHLQGHTQGMWKRATANWVGIVASVLVVIAAMVYFIGTGNNEAFNVVLGVLVGAAVTSIPQVLSRDTERVRRRRAAAILVRSDLYEYQNWILQSFDNSRWVALPTDIATAEHLAELAYEMRTWERWAKVSQARRYVHQLIGMTGHWPPDEKTRDHARTTFETINELKILLAKFDEGPRTPHEETQRALDLIAKTRNSKLRDRLGRRTDPAAPRSLGRDAG